MRPRSSGARQWQQRHGLQLRLTAWYGGTLALLLVITGTLVYGVLAVGVRQTAETDLARRAAQIATALDPDEPDLNFQAAGPDEIVLVYDRQGQLLVPSGPYRPATLPAWAAALSRPGYTTLRLPTGRWLLYALSLHAPQAPQDPGGSGGTLLVGRSIEPLEALLERLVLALVLVGPLVVLLAASGGYFLAGRALAPIAAITRTARRIVAEGLGGNRRIALTGRYDELSELAATLDGLFARLEEAFARERRFTADAAHELRTPLAVVRAETTLALARPRPAAEYRRVLTVVDGEAARLARLVGDLLLLTRADTGSLPLRTAVVDLAAVCTTVGGQLAPVAARKGVHFQLAAASPVLIPGDTVWLTQLVVNLVENGIKYTPAGGTVCVDLHRAADAAVLRVEDSGIGIAPDHLPYIFDRFYRVDKARSRTDATTGYGLGLAICQWIVQAHQGTLTVASQVGQGSCFQVRLPLDGGPPNVVPAQDDPVENFPAAL